MEKRQITTERAPRPAGPYSQGLVLGDLVFVAGQRPSHPETGDVPAGVAEQTRRVLQNVDAVLQAAGSSLRRVVKTTVYLQDLAHFAEMNAVYASFFDEPYPVRTTVGVDLRGILVEIDAIASRGGDAA